MHKYILVFVVLSAFTLETAMADTPEPFPEFSAKRVKPPKSSSSNKIKIQIDQRLHLIHQKHRRHRNLMLLVRRQSHERLVTNGSGKKFHQTQLNRDQGG